MAAGTARAGHAAMEDIVTKLHCLPRRSGWTAAKAKLDARIAESAGRPLPHWTAHDLRRTAATRMADRPEAVRVSPAAHAATGRRTGSRSRTGRARLQLLAS